MAGLRWPPEESEFFSARSQAAGGGVAGDLPLDDDRSVAADSWSIKSDYGSTLDDDQRHVDAAEVLSNCNFPAASDYNSDKDAPDANEFEASILGLQSYWDATYSEDLANFHEHGNPGEIWFGAEVMDVLVAWTKSCISTCQGPNESEEDCKSESNDPSGNMSSWSVLDIGTGNGLLLQELAKQGFSDLTGIDYSERAIELARSLAVRAGLPSIKFVVDDVLDTKLERSFQLVMDKGTLDVIGLHPDGIVRRMMYLNSVSNLLSPGGILVITSCNNTKDELLQEVETFNQQRATSEENENRPRNESAVFQYLDHIRTYSTAIYGGVEGSRLVTVAFLRK